MKRFEFSLETVLRLRASEEREMENRLAAVTGECERLRLSIEKFRKEKLRCAVENGFSDISMLLSVSHYQARMDRDILEAGEMLRRKKKERESILIDFIEASRKRKVLDKLKEKKYNEYHRLSLKEEEKRNDDINNAKWAGTEH